MRILHFWGVHSVGLPFGLLGAIVKLQKVTVRVYKLSSHWADFREVLYWELLL